MATSGSFNTTPYSNRYLTFSWSRTSYSVDNNRSTIHWTLTGGGSASGYYLTQNIRVVIDGTEVYNHPLSDGQIQLYKTTKVTEGDFTIPHASDGSKSFEVYVEAGIYTWAVNCTGSETFTLDTIPQASTLTISNGVLGEAMVITADRKSESFSQTLTWTCGSYSGTICNKQLIRWWSFTPALELASGAPYGDKVYISFRLETYNGNTLVGQPDERGVWLTIPPEVVPTCTVSVTSSAGYFVQGKTTVRVQVTATEAHGSPIKSYSVTIDGKTYTSSSFVTTIKSSGSVRVDASVVDGRSRTGSGYTTVNVLEYSSPVISLLKVARCDSDGTANDNGLYCKATYSYKIAALENHNTKSAYIRYRKSTETEDDRRSITLTASYEANEVSTIFNASGDDGDGGSSYVVELAVSDRYEQVTRSTVLSTAYTLMHFPESGRGLAIGKLSEKDAFEVGMPSEFLDTVKMTKPVEFSDSVKIGNTDINGIADFIITQASSGIWYYRKWNSGIAECWTTYNAQNVNATKNNWQGFYYSDAITVNYPSGLFAFKPVALVDGGDTSTMQFVRVFGGDASKASFHVVCHADSQTAISISVSIRAIGRWK